MLTRLQRDALIDHVPESRRWPLIAGDADPRACELEHELVSAAGAANTAATRGLDEQAVAAFMAPRWRRSSTTSKKAGPCTDKKSNRVRTAAEL
jgi:hypothetical protein